MQHNKSEQLIRYKYYEDKGISCDKNIHSGTACIDGTRLPVRMFRLWTWQQIRDSCYNYLTREQVNAAIRYWNVRGHQQRELAPEGVFPVASHDVAHLNKWPWYEQRLH